ncbi:MAG: hypothetical protein D6820_05655, partial [Lentisphaerae bacterium]
MNHHFWKLFLPLSMLCLAGYSGFEIRTPAGEIEKAYQKIEGIASDIEKPMWFEVVHQGVIIDVGHFKPDRNWFFIARGLRDGKNTITVYAVDRSGHIISHAITLNLRSASVHTRPIPAQLWWGGTADNAQLAAHPDLWNYVKKFADGYFFHTACWGAEKNPVMKSLVQQLAPYGTKFIVELGGGTRPKDDWPRHQHTAWGAGGNGWLISRYRDTGLIVSIVTHDYHAEDLERFVRARPGKSNSYYVKWFSGYWKEYFQANIGVFPGYKHAITQCPVWWPYEELPPLGGDKRNRLRYRIAGKEYRFDFKEVLMAMRQAAISVPQHHNWFAFFSDSPFYTMTWPEPEGTGTMMCR